jgi:nucleotide-binding universal stress UspA family protein
MTVRSAFLPLTTYPETVPDDSLHAALAHAKAMGLDLDLTIYAVAIPQPVTPFGSIVLDIPDLVRRAEDRSESDAMRLTQAVRKIAPDAGCVRRKVVVGAAADHAAAAARAHDLVLLPWADTGTVRDMATALIFGAGRPVLLVPPGGAAVALSHLAVAWDGSRVAARALADGLALLPAGGRVSMVTVAGDKSLDGLVEAGTMADTLKRRGWAAEAIFSQADRHGTAVALQSAARAAGAQVLALGGFGHSRMRDFVLGGVTQGVLADLRMPVLISH